MVIGFPVCAGWALTPAAPTGFAQLMLPGGMFALGQGVFFVGVAGYYVFSGFLPL